MLSPAASTSWRSVLYEEYVSASIDDAEVEPLHDYSFVVVVSGSALVESWSGYSWKQASYRVGSIGLTPPDRGARLRWRTDEQVPLRTAHLFVPHTLVCEIADDLGAYSDPDALPNALNLDDELVHATIGAIGQSAKLPDAGEDYARSAAHFLITHILSRFGTPRKSESHREFQRVKGVLREAAFSHRNAVQLAAEAGVSEARLRRVVRDVTGGSLHSYLETLHLAEACRLLEKTSLSMTQISYRCAFASPSHFAARFRRRLGSRCRDGVKTTVRR